MSAKTKLGLKRQWWLAKELGNWFEASEENPARWWLNPVGKAIREGLIKAGHWKSKPRGNPKKGGYASQRAQFERYGKNMLLERFKKKWEREGKGKAVVVPAPVVGEGGNPEKKVTDEQRPG